MVLPYSYRYIDAKKPNFGFPRSDLQVLFMGFGGLTIDDLTTHPARIVVLRRFRPQTLILMVGDNDILPSTNPASIVHLLLVAARRLFLLIPSVTNIVFSKLMPRHPTGTSRYHFEGYNRLALQVNELLLREVIPRQGLRLFRVNIPFPAENAPRFANSESSCYKRDGVHLKELGNKKLALAFRSVIIASLNGRL